MFYQCYASQPSGNKTQIHKQIVKQNAVGTVSIFL